MAIDVGKLIKDLVDLKAAKAALEGQVDRKGEEIDAKKLEIRAALEGAGITEARNSTHSASVKEYMVPQAVSWDQTYDFIHENKYYHLLHRRLSVEGCRELWASGTSIPGVEPFKYIDISLRKA